MTVEDPILDARAGFAKGIMPAKDVILLVKGTAFPETRGVLVGTAGTLNIVTAVGATRSDVPFQVGITPIRIQELLAGGTGDDVWGVY